MTDPDWWRTAVVYQIYPRSFADSDGDGIGDLTGVAKALPYLSELGIDAIWLTPFYPSPLADGGYDISDYRNVDPRLGSLADFDRLTDAAHDRAIRVLIDLVPNHTSANHPWFREALAAQPGSDARKRYIFRRGTDPDTSQPPSDWRSHFGGSGWEPLPDGDWYFHMFAREQPDLNWDNHEIRADFLSTLRFWANRGVDGFRVDVAHALAKDLSEPLRSQPNLDSAVPTDGSDPLYDRDDVHAIYRSWRQVFDEYDPPRIAVAETWTPTNSRTYLYARPTELGQVFDFSLLKSPWDAQLFASVIRRSLADHAAHADDGGGLTWVLSSHDVVRHASRLALPVDVAPEEWLLTDGREPEIDIELGLRRARAATMLMMALPGTAYLYQGEELGLPEVADLPPESLHDPVWVRSLYTQKGRDGCRVPLPWIRDCPHFGFSNATPWLPQPAQFAEYAAQTQEHDVGSTLQMYRAAIALRRKLQTPGTELTWITSQNSAVLRFARPGGWQSITNFDTEPQELPHGTVILASSPAQEGVLPAACTVWLRTVPSE